LYSQADTLVDVSPGDEWSWEFRADGKVLNTHIYKEKDVSRTEEARAVGMEETDEGCVRVTVIPQRPANPLSRIKARFKPRSKPSGLLFLFCAEELTIHYPAGGIAVCRKRH
jgi:hypothetical protein